MAMAFLAREGQGRGETVRFRADLGSSRWFTIRIGPGETVEQDGFALLADPSYVGELTGPLPPERLGRVLIDVPAHRFDREHAYIQLVSYRDAPDLGPAVSAILHAGPAAGARPRRDQGGTSMSTSFALEERPYSEALFLQSLLPLLNNALPIITQLFGGAGKPAAAGGDKAAGGLDVQALAGAIQQLLAALAKPAATAQTKSLSASPGEWGGTGYAEAAIAPALLAALPALAPLVEKAMNPETLKAIGSITPTGQANAANEQVRRHLERIMPSADTAQIYQLLALLAMQESTSSLRAAMPPFTPAPGATLGFDAATADPGIPLGGRPRRLYRTDRAGVFPLTVETPRPLPRSRLRWQVKLATSADAILDEERELDPVAGSGPLPVSPVLSPAELARLTPGEEHVLCVYLLFETAAGRTLGLTALLPFVPAGEYVFDAVTGVDEGRVLAFDDVEKHRDYWHKAWAATLTDEVFRYQYECKYYYGLDVTAGESRRGVTRVQDDPRELHTQTGRLEASMRIGLSALNGLLPRLGAGLDSLGQAELDALRSKGFARRFDTAARSEVRFGGNRGTSVALWVFPEMTPASVVLRHCGETNAAGRVLAAPEHIVRFPVPTAATFVGVTSDS